jgi:hypothetical protein
VKVRLGGHTKENEMSEYQPTQEYRFGFTKEQIVSEIMGHSGLLRDGCYVPTKHEVATWPADRLWMTLLGWWWESPSSLIPNDQQVAESVAVLQARPDAQSEGIQRIIAQAPPPAEGVDEGRRAEDGANDVEGESG